VTFPNGGENLAGDSITVTWTGADADGDPLTYMLQYSSDNGATWEALTADLTATSYNVPRRLLRRTSAGRVRVIASDGFSYGIPAGLMKRLGALSDFFGIVRSGGSDWHGAKEGARTIGCMHVPAEWLARQDAAAAKRDQAEVA